MERLVDRSGELDLRQCLIRWSVPETRILVLVVNGDMAEVEEVQVHVVEVTNCVGTEVVRAIPLA